MELLRNSTVPLVGLKLLSITSFFLEKGRMCDNIEVDMTVSKWDGLLSRSKVGANSFSKNLLSPEKMAYLRAKTTTKLPF